jgi:His-Xaa-Ser system protein HxsD
MASAELAIDLSVYPLTVVQKTAYEFADRVDVIFRKETANFATLRLTARGHFDLAEIEALFHRRLLDLTVQDQIFQQTSGIREALVRAALAQADPSSCYGPPGTSKQAKP